VFESFFAEEKPSVGTSDFPQSTQKQETVELVPKAIESCVVEKTEKKDELEMKRKSESKVKEKESKEKSEKIKKHHSTRSTALGTNSTVSCFFFQLIT
jgi:hypothetical protein